MITMRPQFQISTRKIKLLLSLTAACCLLACMSIKRGEFDQRSYDSAIANKAIVTRLVAKSTQVDSFLAHESKIHQLIEKMDAVAGWICAITGDTIGFESDERSKREPLGSSPSGDSSLLMACLPS